MPWIARVVVTITVGPRHAFVPGEQLQTPQHGLERLVAHHVDRIVEPIRGVEPERKGMAELDRIIGGTPGRIDAKHKCRTRGVMAAKERRKRELLDRPGAGHRERDDGVPAQPRQPPRVEQLDRGVAEDGGVDVLPPRDAGGDETRAEIGDAVRGQQRGVPGVVGIQRQHEGAKSQPGRQRDRHIAPQQAAPARRVGRAVRSGSR